MNVRLVYFPNYPVLDAAEASSVIDAPNLPRVGEIIVVAEPLRPVKAIDRYVVWQVEHRWNTEDCGSCVILRGHHRSFDFKSRSAESTEPGPGRETAKGP